MSINTESTQIVSQVLNYISTKSAKIPVVCASIGGMMGYAVSAGMNISTRDSEDDGYAHNTYVLGYTVVGLMTGCIINKCLQVRQCRKMDEQAIVQSAEAEQIQEANPDMTGLQAASESNGESDIELQSQGEEAEYEKELPFIARDNTNEEV